MSNPDPPPFFPLPNIPLPSSPLNQAKRAHNHHPIPIPILHNQTPLFQRRIPVPVPASWHSGTLQPGGRPPPRERLLSCAAAHCTPHRPCSASAVPGLNSCMHPFGARLTVPQK
ncbi:uncharacterized protein K444DRAFT_33320 [Hyaloscypha bicolor E]|uniref:Uncharacterized protein n=1 Tax=Hyaloscypha bicolor E TaxID=1095630 RepID=A0A2J6T117_9HELO|nr:uncharacterized protein K444DRAFT_33320 [Hyaloscypha bicolor E]PMD56714.1 hypothetical protein K444DRAFT_33320 [Hyaloscypha bicolor E]